MIKSFMPEIIPEDVYPEVRSSVEDYMRDSERRGRFLGLEEKRYDDRVPLRMENNLEATGRTDYRERFGKTETKDVKLQKKYFDMVRRADIPEDYKRVLIETPIEHELDHVNAERLVQYADVDEESAISVIESIPTYGGFKYAMQMGDEKKAAFIYNMSKGIYEKAFNLGLNADRYYKSPIDGERGYRTFVRDIQRMSSMKAVLGYLNECEKESNVNYI